MSRSVATEKRKQRTLKELLWMIPNYAWGWKLDSDVKIWIWIYITLPPTLLSNPMIESHFPHSMTYFSWFSTTKSEVKVTFPLRGIVCKKISPRARLGVVKSVAQSGVTSILKHRSLQASWYTRNVNSHLPNTHKHEVGRAVEFLKMKGTWCWMVVLECSYMLL